MERLKTFSNLEKETESYIYLFNVNQNQKFKKQINLTSNKFIYVLFIIILLFNLSYILYQNRIIKYLKENLNQLEFKLKKMKNIIEINENNYSKNIGKFKKNEIRIKNLENELSQKNFDFKEKEQNYLEIIKINNKNEYNKILKKKNFTNIFLQKINEIYKKQGYINLNELESTLPEGRSWSKMKNKKNEINVGSSLDPNYILRTMMTTASLMDSQKNETNLRIHFSVVNNFTSENMLKIYSLREKIREDVEFNFYNAKRIEKDMKGQAGEKGNGLMAKLLLPQLLNEDIEKLIIIDNGDCIVLRDLTEMYNWNMSNYLYVGIPDPIIGRFGPISNKPLNIYINTGTYLINVKKVKEEKMYEKFIKNRSNFYNSLIADQDFINDVAYGRIGYLPIKFGAIPIFVNDNHSDEQPFKTFYESMDYYNKIKNSGIYPYYLRNENDLYYQTYNPYIVHQYSEKWMFGKGMTIYRRIAQYYIKYAGIWNEICSKFSGYCTR